MALNVHFDCRRIGNFMPAPGKLLQGVVLATAGLSLQQLKATCCDCDLLGVAFRRGLQA